MTETTGRAEMTAEKSLQQPASTESKAEEGQARDPDSVDEDEEEEEETCGFCIFMKGGGCKKEFVAWSKCVDEGREEGRDFAAECREQTMALQACMQRNREYYGDMLEAQELEADTQREDGSTEPSEENGAVHSAKSLDPTHAEEERGLDKEEDSAPDGAKGVSVSDSSTSAKR